MRQIQPSQQTEKALRKERLPICNSKMVHQVDYRWNQFYGSLMRMHEKLVKFGLIYCNGKVLRAEELE